MKLIAILTTTASHVEAREIAAALVERKLVACAQISEIESFYRWEGAVHHEPEFRILLKTTEERYAAVESAIRELHSYTLPAIVAIPIDRAYEPYAEWVAGESAGEA